MNGAFEISGVGLESQQRALEIIANNIANINTPAFKRTDVRFSALMAGQTDPAAPTMLLGSAPNLAGVSAEGVLALNEQGDIERTENQLDLAIDGSGFIELLGACGESVIWRGGTLDVNEDGLLSGGGLPLKAMISIPSDASDLQIDAHGAVSALVGDARQALGQIDLVQVDDARAIEGMDQGLYRVLDRSFITDVVAGEDGAGSFVQGAIEHSNVELNDEMIQLMILQRAFSANAQVVQAADQIMALANNLRK